MNPLRQVFIIGLGRFDIFGWFEIEQKLKKSFLEWKLLKIIILLLYNYKWEEFKNN